MKKRLMMLVLVTVISVVSGCNKEQSEKEAPELLEPVGKAADTADVTKSDISNTKIYDAQVIPYTEEMGFETEGTIKEIKVRLGDEVKAGDILAVLDGAGEDNEYEALSEELGQLKVRYAEENLAAEYDIKIMNTEKRLLEKKKNKKEAELKQIDIDIAKAELDGKKKLQMLEKKELKRKKKLAYEQLQKFYIKAGMDGVITCINYNPGDSVLTNEFVLAVSDNNSLQIKSDFVSKRELAMADSYYVLYKNRHYGVTQHEYDPAEIDGLIAEDLPVYSYFDIEDSETEFGVGDSLELYVESDACKDVLVIPSNALYTEEGHNCVYKKSGENKVRTEVTVGVKTASVVQIIDGVKEGDVVYVKE